MRQPNLCSAVSTQILLSTWPCWKQTLIPLNTHHGIAFFRSCGLGFLQYSSSFCQNVGTKNEKKKFIICANADVGVSRFKTQQDISHQHQY